MSWKTDWLYQLVFREVDRIWQRAVNDGHASFGPSPDYFIVSQFADVLVRPYKEIAPEAEVRSSLLHAGFVRPVIKQWKFDDLGVRSDLEASFPLQKINPIRGMFFQVGEVSFGLELTESWCSSVTTLAHDTAKIRFFACMDRDAWVN